MKLRQSQAEGVYARLKEQLKFTKCYALGLPNASKKFLIACSVLNLKKLLPVLSALQNTGHFVFKPFFDYFKERILFSTRFLHVLP